MGLGPSDLDFDTYGSVPGVPSSLTCQRDALVAAIFSPNRKGYEDCIRCDSSTPETLGFFQGIGPGQTCSASGFAQNVYMETTQYPCGADATAGLCQSEGPYTTNFPNECTDISYQIRKRTYVKTQATCNELVALLGHEIDTAPPISQMCPPNPYDFFTKCNELTNECTYVAQTVAPAIIDSCKNTYERCEDPLYVKDLEYYNRAKEICAKRYEQHKAISPWLWLYGALFSIICFSIGFGLYAHGNKLDRDQAAAMGMRVAYQSWGARFSTAQLFQSVSRFYLMFFGLLVTSLALLGIGIWMMVDKVFFGLKPDSSNTIAIVMLVFGILFMLGALGYAIYSAAKTKARTSGDPRCSSNPFNPSNYFDPQTNLLPCLTNRMPFVPK